MSFIEWSYAKNHVFNEMKFGEASGDKSDQYIVVCLRISCHGFSVFPLFSLLPLKILIKDYVNHFYITYFCCVIGDLYIVKKVYVRRNKGKTIEGNVTNN